MTIIHAAERDEATVKGSPRDSPVYLVHVASRDGLDHHTLAPSSNDYLLAAASSCKHLHPPAALPRNSPLAIEPFHRHYHRESCRFAHASSSLDTLHHTSPIPHHTAEFQFVPPIMLPITSILDLDLMQLMQFAPVMPQPSLQQLLSWVRPPSRLPFSNICYTTRPESQH